MTISDRLHKLREAVDGLSNSELDRLCGLRKGHTWALEHKGAKANPELRTLRVIAAALGVSVGYLATGECGPPSPADVRAAVAKARKRLQDGLPPLAA